MLERPCAAVQANVFARQGGVVGLKHGCMSASRAEYHNNVDRGPQKRLHVVNLDVVVLCELTDLNLLCRSLQLVGI